MQPIESLNLMLLNVGFARHNGDWNWSKVSSPFMRIFLVTEGTAYVHFPSEIVKLKPGHLYIIPAYTLHSYQCSGIFSHYYLHVSEGYKKETDFIEHYDLPVDVAASEDDVRIFQKLCQMCPDTTLPDSNPIAYDNSIKFFDYVNRYNNTPLSEKMMLRGMMLILLSHFIAEATPREWTNSERITNIVNYIHNHLSDEIDINKIASEACVTKPYFIRLFKKEMGIPPLQYVNKKRIERSQLKLVTEDTSIKEIAYSLGFSDHSYFTRLFRKTTGCSPQKYRLMYRGRQ